MLACLFYFPEKKGKTHEHTTNRRIKFGWFFHHRRWPLLAKVQEQPRNHFLELGLWFSHQPSQTMRGNGTCLGGVAIYGPPFRSFFWNTVGLFSLFFFFGKSVKSIVSATFPKNVYWVFWSKSVLGSLARTGVIDVRLRKGFTHSFTVTSSYKNTGSSTNHNHRKQCNIPGSEIQT